MFEGFDSKLTSGVTGSLSATTNITAGNNLAAGNSLTVGNDATITDELYLPGIENVVTNNFLMYNTSTDAVSFAHRDFVNVVDRTVPRINQTNTTGLTTTGGFTGGLTTINSSSSPYNIYFLNGKNIITTNTGGQNSALRLSFLDWNPSIYGDFSCTILHKGHPTQDGGFSNQDMKLQIYLPATSIVGSITYNVAMIGSDSADNYEMEQYVTYNAGEVIQFSDQTKWDYGSGNLFPYTQGRRMENSGLFHINCSFSTNYICVHGTNWERIPFNQTP
jgi:hypothetical protein